MANTWRNDGQDCPAQAPFPRSLEEWYTITGGTGRFAGASGGYTAHRLVDTNTGDTRGTFDGSIMLAQGQ